MIPTVLLLLLFLPGLQSEEILCESATKESGLDGYCKDKAELIAHINEFFDNHVFGSTILEDLKINAMEELCEKYRECPPYNKYNCFLPRINIKITCKKIKLLKSQYGSCMKKLQNKKIVSESLESLMKDYTNYGISRKCLLLKNFNDLSQALYEECGEAAEESFKKSYEDLKTFFDC